MPQDINDRIKFLREDNKLSQTAFANKLGVSRGVIQNIEDKNTTPKPVILQQICSQFKVDPDWLETGEGDPYIKTDSVTDLFEFTKNLFLDRNLSWVRCLCEYIAQLTPEEQEAAARHIESLAEMIAENKEKEQD